MRDDQTARLRKQQRAFEAELAQLLADGPHHVGCLGLASQARRGGGEHRLVLSCGCQIAQRTQPLPLLPELGGRLMAQPAQCPEERAPRLAIHPQPKRTGALALEQQRDVGAPQLDGRELRADLERFGDVGADAREAQRFVFAFWQRRAFGQLAQALRGLLPPRFVRRERSSQRGEVELDAIFAEQVAPHPKLGEERATDRRGVVDDPLKHPFHASERTGADEARGSAGRRV